MNCIDKSFKILMIIIYISYKMIQGDLEIIQLCNSCGYQRIVEVSAGQNIDTECPHCNNNNFRGIIFYFFLQKNFDK